MLEEAGCGHASLATAAVDEVLGLFVEDANLFAELIERDVLGFWNGEGVSFGEGAYID